MSSLDIKTCCLCLALFAMSAAAIPAGAQEDSPNPMVVSAGFQLDDEESTDLLLGVDYGVTEKTWLNAYVGYTDASDDVSNVTFKTGLLGIDHRFGKLGLSGSVEFWGDPDEVDSTDVRGQVYFRNGGFRAALIAERRNIDVTARAMTMGRPVERVFRLDAEALGASLRYSGEDYTVYGSYLDYDYSADPARLNLLFAFRFLSRSALTLANSFLDDSATAGLDIEFEDKVFNVELASYSGAVDRLDTDSVSAGLLFPVSDRADIEVRLGRSDTESLGRIAFGGVTFFIYR